MPTTNPRPSILIVDDIEANLIAFEAQLLRLNCDIVRATSGNEALKLLLKREFAVLLLDVQMPEMDGYEVATYVRENPSTRELPIIFITAMHETEENALKGYSTGAVDCLFKPVNPEILRSKVQVFLDLHNNKQRLTNEIEAHKRTLAELEAFNYSISHDLRAPLRPLEGFSQALLEDYGSALDAKAKDYLVRIGAAAQRMSQLIEDLLRLSRLGRAEMTMRPVDLTSIADSIVVDLKHAEPTRVVHYISSPTEKASGDARLLRIVLENLLRNAWKFTQRTADARIEFGMKSDQGEPVYFVKDNGAGFNPEFSARLFQPFQRLHTSNEYEGTGIGLAIVQRIIRRHQGNVWAEATPQQGATFFFTIQEPKRAL